MSTIALTLLSVFSFLSSLSAESSLYATDPRKVVTPHIKWARPLWGPKPKVLFVLMGGGAREAYELAQRMDMQFDVFATTKYWIFAPTSDYYNEGIPLLDERIKEMRKLLAKNPDVILVGSIRMGCFPREIMYRILEQVTKGAALITCNNDLFFDMGHLSRKTQLQILSQPLGHLSRILGGVTWGGFHRTAPERNEHYRLATGGYIRYGEMRRPLVLGRANCWRVKKGYYIAICPYGARMGYSVGPTIGPAVPVAFKDLIETEYYYSMVLKAIRWAVPRCRAPVSIKSVEPNATSVKLPVQGPATLMVTVSIENSTRQEYNVVLRSVLRDETRAVIQQKEKPVTIHPGRQEIEVKFSAVGAGRWWSDHWLLVDGKVMDWGSGVLDVVTDCRVSIEELSAPSRRANLYGRAHVAGAGQNAVLRMECEDARGRILGRRDYQLPRGGPVTFHFFHGAGHDPHQYLVARVLDGPNGRAIAIARRHLVIPPGPPDEYYVYSTGGCMSSWLGYLRAQIVKDLGADAQRGDTGSIAGYTGIRPGPFFTHIGGCNYKGVASLNDETGYRRQLSEGLRAIARLVKPLGGHVFNLGDDTGVGKTLCKVQPYWCQVLRKIMGKKYRNKIGDLNAAWGVKLKSFASMTAETILDAKLPSKDFLLLKKEWQNEYVSIHAMNRAWGTDFQSWDDVSPSFLRNARWVSPCWRAYVRFLQREYGTLEKLGCEWGIRVGSWDEIEPATLLNARDAGNTVPWISYLRFQEDSYVGIMACAAAAVRDVIPDAAVGQDASALENILPEVLRHTSYYCPYYSLTAIEKMRSFAKRPGRYGACIGVYGGKAVPGPVRRHQPINVAFAGGNTIMFWAMSIGLHGVSP